MTSRVDYNNPESFYPLQSGEARGEAFGSGTTPGSFLAGWMLPERLGDYRDSRDISQQAGRLANLQAEAQFKDFQAAGPLRDVQRRVQMGEGQNTLALQPGALSIAAGRQQGEMSRLPNEEKLKYNQAGAAVTSQKRGAEIEELLHVSNLLQQYVDPGTGQLIGDENIIAQDLKKYGVNIDPRHIKGLATLNPEQRKQMMKMAEHYFNQTQETGRTLETNESRERIANIAANAKDHSGAGLSAKNKEEWTNEYAKIREEELLAEGKPPAIAKRQARKEAIQMAMREAQYQQQAIGDVQSQLPANKIEAIQARSERKKFVQKRFSNDPKMKGYELGPYNEENKGYEVYDKNGNPVGFYD